MWKISPLDFYLHTTSAILMEQWSFSAPIHWTHFTYTSHIQGKTQKLFFRLSTQIFDHLFDLLDKDRSVKIALFIFYSNTLIGSKCTPCAPHLQKGEGGAQNCCKSADLREQVGVNKIQRSGQTNNKKTCLS